MHEGWLASWVARVWSVRASRVRAPAQWRDELCSQFPLHPCDEGVLQGGWPLAFLLDKPGISVMAQLGLIEDRFEATPFFLDLALFWAALLGASWLPAARRRGGAP